MDGRMVEVRDGCYYQTQAPCCNIYYFAFDTERTRYTAGPGCCGCCFCCPCPGFCSTSIVVGGTGSATFINQTGYTDRWQTPTTFLRFGTAFPGAGEKFSKC